MSQLIVADSGGTKTLWLDPETGNSITTEGLNPHFATDQQIAVAVGAAVEALGQPTQLRFYGAGCGSESQRQRMERLLATTSRAARVDVGTDMLLACHATLGTDAGLVAILGTGSNICYYDGTVISDQPRSTGYILGDRGSACHLGRLLAEAYISEAMPQHLRVALLATFGMDADTMLQTIYHGTTPNRFLASLAPFVTAHTDDDYCLSLLQQVLDAWWNDVERITSRHTDCSSLQVVGGFAAAIEAQLRHFATSHGIDIPIVTASPLERLSRRHAPAPTTHPS